MSETITFHALDLAGETGLKLYLRQNDGTLLNTGGDALSDLGSAGVFTATLAESRVGLGTLHARVCDGTETADNSVFEEFLPESETVIGATGGAVLNSATQGQIDAMTRGLIAGVVGSSSSTTVVNVTSTESGLAVTDQLKGRVIIFNKDTTTAALRGQGAPIDTNDTTSITVASGDAFTTAPASGDTFTIY